MPWSGTSGALSIGNLKALKNVNLMSDLETLTKQADAVRDEIIAHGNYLRLFYENDRSNKSHTVFNANNLTDFIRTQSGKIVYPFNFWEDCIEVWLRKLVYRHSNEKIASEYTFKTSTSAAMRAKMKLVSDMLSESRELAELAEHARFPPKILSGLKQPTIVGDKLDNNKIS